MAAALLSSTEDRQHVLSWQAICLDLRGPSAPIISVLREGRI